MARIGDHQYLPHRAFRAEPLLEQSSAPRHDAHGDHNREQGKQTGEECGKEPRFPKPPYRSCHRSPPSPSRLLLVSTLLGLRFESDPVLFKTYPSGLLTSRKTRSCSQSYPPRARKNSGMRETMTRLHFLIAPLRQSKRIAPFLQAVRSLPVDPRDRTATVYRQGATAARHPRRDARARRAAHAPALGQADTNLAWHRK